jgi:hypothetical protein
MKMDFGKRKATIKGIPNSSLENGKFRIGHVWNFHLRYGNQEGRIFRV